MTIPDKLIQAGAAALSEKCRLKAGGECVKYARVAIAAAFAALPECDELRAEDHGDAWGEAHSCGWNEALATLARMAQP